MGEKVNLHLDLNPKRVKAEVGTLDSKPRVLYT